MLAKRVGRAAGRVDWIDEPKWTASALSFATVTTVAAKPIEPLDRYSPTRGHPGAAPGALRLDGESYRETRLTSKSVHSAFIRPSRVALLAKDSGSIVFWMLCEAMRPARPSSASAAARSEAFLSRAEPLSP